MNIEQIKPCKYYSLCFKVAFCALLLYSCGGGHNAPDNTGTLAVKFVYQDAAGKSKANGAGFDCTQEGVETIKAMVFDQDNILIKDPDPWKCELRRGTIKAVKAGDDRTVVILGRDVNNNVIFRGELSGITVVANINNEPDQIIQCSSFVPSLQTPDNGAMKNTGAVPLSWSDVDGATEYRVLVSKQSDMTDPIINEKTQKAAYSLSFSYSGIETYFWQVEALDAFGNTGTGSSVRSIVTSLFSSVSTGAEHTLAVDSEGGLWSWGRNIYGQLGHGDSGMGTERSSPTRVGSDTGWAHVAAGRHHSVAIKTDGTLWSWGLELGVGEDVISIRNTPTFVGSDNDWAYATAGDRHTVAIKHNGQLWVWGENDHGQLGRDSSMRESEPTYFKGDTWAFVAAGSLHTVAINTKGQLWGWGSNANDQLGPFGQEDQRTPVEVDSASDWAFVDTSETHTVALKTNGELWSWGDNSFGQLGLEDDNDRVKPERIGTQTDWVHVVAGRSYTLAVKKNGELWSWGRNGYGQLGIGEMSNRAAVSKVDLANCVFASARINHVAAVNTNGEIWCWGKNTFGELGNGKMGRKLSPTQINEDTDWDSIAIGNSNKHTLAIKANGQLWAWGHNAKGQMGIGGIYHLQIPTKIDDAGSWISVATSDIHTAAIKKADAGNGHTLWSWGHGYLGSETIDFTNTPLQVGNDQGWDSVSCGLSQTFAIMVKGTDAAPKRTLWSWGTNLYGELGHGDSGVDTVRYIPTQVGSDTSWAAVAAGSSHVVGMKTNGTLWSWGRNDHGQLGRDYPQHQSSPLHIGTVDDNDWASIAAGSYHSVATKTDGTLWSWGFNGYGQLGHGQTEPEHIQVPTQVNSEDNAGWRSVAASNNHTLAIRSDNTLWGWGENSAGQLGEENVGLSVSSPNQIGTDADWASVTAGFHHSVAIKADGTCWSWGENLNGQLGVGNAWELLPVHVPLQ